MKKTKQIIILAVIAMFTFGCNDFYNVDCETYENCLTYEPYDELVKIKVTVNKENEFVPITIYIGDLEENNIYIQDTTNFSVYEIYLPVNKDYTATAKYKKGNQTIIAVDGGNLDTKSTDVCDSICWTVKELELDLWLKN